jgi:hypothetical protein
MRAASARAQSETGLRRIGSEASVVKATDADRHFNVRTPLTTPKNHIEWQYVHEDRSAVHLCGKGFICPAAVGTRSDYAGNDTFMPAR